MWISGCSAPILSQRFSPKNAKATPAVLRHIRFYRRKSKISSRVGHVFGYTERPTGSLIFGGLLRDKANKALNNLVYNIARLCQV